MAKKKRVARQSQRRKSVKKTAQVKVKDVARKEISDIRQTARAEAIFYAAPAPAVQHRITENLPYGYGRDKIVLQVRDPRWCHAYWEVASDTLHKLKNELKDAFYHSKRALRVYDVSQIIFNGHNAHRFFDLEINEHADNWYIDTASPGRSWCVDFGLLLADGRFITIARSNTVSTPIEGPSGITDEEWMIPEDLFARLYGMGVGLGSSPVKIKKLWEQRLAREMVSGGLFSVSSPTKKVGKKGFWLAVNTELIVYGATEPNAKVSIQGREIKLRPDGTFTLRFALPDARLAIPVKAESYDAKEERTITPIVTRETK